ncbi:MAG: helix-turn-helix protein [Bacilli bacterium]|nr:helix-turn-helix protein [Bacilli bacterium]
MIKCNLAVLMAERKMSIQDVADKTGLSRTTISALVNENGKGIQFDTMDDLCELLKVTPGDLFSFASIKTDFSIYAGEFNDEKVYGDEEGNAIEIVRSYDLTIHTKVKSDLSIFEGHISAELEINLNGKYEITRYTFRLDSTELKKFLTSLPFSHGEYIQEAFESEVHQFVSDLREAKGFANTVSTSFNW